MKILNTIVFNSDEIMEIIEEHIYKNGSELPDEYEFAFNIDEDTKEIELHIYT